MAKRTKPEDSLASRPMISTGMGGASDDSSGGGNASGTPDADTAMRAGGSPPPGNVKRDREKLFPRSSRSAKGAGRKSAGRKSTKR